MPKYFRTCMGASVCDHMLLLKAPAHLTIQKIKILKKWKKTPKDLIILHRCTINDNHMMYGSWDAEHNGQNILSFWTIFCPFTSLTIRKNQNFEKLKESLEILSFYTCAPWMTIIWCMVPEISSVADIFFCHFGQFFALLAS